MKSYWDTKAYNYKKTVLSPLDPRARNPLIPFVKSLDNNRICIVGDFGCGTGELIPLLAGRFKKVWAVDQSEQMIDIAKERNNYPNVWFAHEDASNLAELERTLDLAVAVNSILDPDMDRNRRFVGAIRSFLKEGGYFAAIFPAFDTVLHLREIMRMEIARRGNNSDQAVIDFFDIDRKMDSERGLFADDGVNLQKFFLEQELYSLLSDASFGCVGVAEKVYYPWELAKEFGYGYFPGHEEIWDWFVVCRK